MPRRIAAEAVGRDRGIFAGSSAEYACPAPTARLQRDAQRLPDIHQVRGAYDYFTFHTSYLDAGFRWHAEWDRNYGTPLNRARVTRQPGA